MKLIHVRGDYHFYERKDGKFEIQLPDGCASKGLTVYDIRNLSDACIELVSKCRAQDLPGKPMGDRLPLEPSHGHHCPECGNPWEHKGSCYPCGEPEIKCAKCANAGQKQDLFEETDPR